jgi:hypothetical protein
VWNGSAAVACDFVVDAVQLEQKAYATSYCDGTIGTGYAWSGTANASASVRTKADIYTSSTNRLNAFRGSAAARFTRLVDTGAPQQILGLGYNTAGQDEMCIKVASNDAIQGEFGSNGAGDSFPTHAVTTVVGTSYLSYHEWNGLAVMVNLNNAGDVRATRNPPAGNPASYISIGSVNLFNSHLNGTVRGAILSRPLTLRERNKLAATPLWTWGMLDAA